MPESARPGSVRPGSAMLWRLLAAAAVAAALTTAGCGGAGGPQQETVSFASAEQGQGPVAVEGIPDTASIRRESGKPTQFTIREESSAREMRVVAQPEVNVPANLSSASYVTVTGTYDPTQRVFNATEVQTRVPTREQQPRG